MARLLSDAAALQPRAAGGKPGRAAQEAPVQWSKRARALADRIGRAIGRVLDPLGGAPGFTGLASVALAGVWMGFAVPAPLAALESLMAGTLAAQADAGFDDPAAYMLADLEPFLTAEDFDDY